MTRQSQWSVKGNAVNPIGRRRQTGYRGVLVHPDLDGWELTVDTAWTDTGGDKIRRLELKSLEAGTELTGEQLRLITPRSVLAAMNDGWVLEDDSVVVPEPLPSGTRSRRTDEYLFQLAEAVLNEKSASRRRALAMKFERSESQIRDDLLAATKKRFLAQSGPGKRSRVAGPRLLTERTKRIKKGTAQ